MLAPTLVAQIITDKYQNHLPHYRQSHRFLRRGRSLLNAEELHRFILGEYKKQRPADNVGQALVYTLLANCRAQDLDPEDHLAEVIKRLPPDATLDQAAVLPPARIAAERRA